MKRELLRRKERERVGIEAGCRLEIGGQMQRGAAFHVTQPWMCPTLEQQRHHLGLPVHRRPVLQAVERDNRES